MNEQKIVLAHTRSIRHRIEIEASVSCGCFYCISVFEPSKIVDWCDDGQTALCPNCGIDSVIGDASGYSIETSFLSAMQQHWFNHSANMDSEQTFEPFTVVSYMGFKRKN